MAADSGRGRDRKRTRVPRLPLPSLRRAPALTPRPLIVGGGPAGCAAAITLARGGAAPLLVERSRETGDALCGGFLSWQTLAALERLGIDRDALNPHPIRRVRLFAGGAAVQASLPAPGLAVSRRRLDTLLLAVAAAAGSGIERGVPVRAVEGGRVRTDDGADLDSSALFLASGKHDIRGLARPSAARGADPVLGLRLRLPPSPALAAAVGDAVELHLFRGGYAGLALQEDGSANLAIAVRRSVAPMPATFLRRLGDAGPLGERLAGADLTTRFDAVANVPYGWRVRAGTAGLFRLGDQAGVIPSLAGEGIGIALSSGMGAAHALLTSGAESAVSWQRSFARRLARPIGIARMMRDLAEGRGLPLLMTLARVPGLIRAMASATRVDHS